MGARAALLSTDILSVRLVKRSIPKPLTASTGVRMSVGEAARPARPRRFLFDPSATVPAAWRYWPRSGAFRGAEQAERAGRAHIKIVAGDVVVVEMSRYDLTSGRIIFPI